MLLRFSTAALLLAGAAVGGAEPVAPPETVTVSKVKQVTAESPRRYVGMAEAIEHVDIMPRVSGTLLKVNFTEGGTVRRGELLYELEDTTYRAAVNALKAQKEQQEAQVRYAETQFERSKALIERKAISQTSHDKAVLDRDSAKARLREIEAQLTDAENNLSYTRIYSPITGRIGKSAFTVGNLITPQGGKLADIEKISPIYVRFSLGERVFRRDFGGAEEIRSKAAVRILLADRTEYSESAGIALIDNKINTSTNSLTLWASFPNKDGQILPGSFVTVMLTARSDRPMNAVEPSALIPDGKGYRVYVLDADNRVSARKVRAGNPAGNLQIVLSGLDGTETVISDGTHKVRPGMTVNPVPAQTGKQRTEK